MKTLQLFRQSMSLLLTGVIFLSGCAGPSQEAVAESELIIGVITYPDDDIEGYSTNNAVNLAVDEINVSGGVTVSGVTYTLVTVFEEISARAPEEAVAAAQKLINQENVAVIIGPQRSGDAIPAGGAAEAAGVPLISGVSSNPATTQDRDYVFRMGFVDTSQGVVIANLALKNLSASTAAVLYDISDVYSTGIAEVFIMEFEARGGTIVAIETYTNDYLVYDQQLERIRDLNPDVLLLPNSSSYVEAQAVLAREMGITATLLGGDGWDRVGFREIPAFEGAFMTTNWTKDSESPISRTFVETYIEQYGIEPGDTAALTYDAIHLVVEAILLEGSATPDAIRDGLYNLVPYEGVGGVIDFTNNGDPVRSGVILQFQNGQDVFYTTVDP